MHLTSSMQNLIPDWKPAVSDRYYFYLPINIKK